MSLTLYKYGEKPQSHHRSFSFSLSNLFHIQIMIFAIQSTKTFAVAILASFTLAQAVKPTTTSIDANGVAYTPCDADQLASLTTSPLLFLTISSTVVVSPTLAPSLPPSGGGSYGYQSAAPVPVASAAPVADVAPAAPAPDTAAAPAAQAILSGAVSKGFSALSVLAAALIF